MFLMVYKRKALSFDYSLLQQLSYNLPTYIFFCLQGEMILALSHGIGYNGYMVCVSLIGRVGAAASEKGADDGKILRTGGFAEACSW